MTLLKHVDVAQKRIDELNIPTITGKRKKTQLALLAGFYFHYSCEEARGKKGNMNVEFQRLHHGNGH